MGLLKKSKMISDLGLVDFNGRMNILLCSDRNVIRGLGVTAVSVLENTEAPCALHIAFNGTLPEQEEERFRELSRHYKVPVCFYWIDDTAIQALRSNSFITVTAYYRLLMPYVLHDFGIQRCLYLDTDILCAKDIEEWYFQPLKGKIAFVTKDATAQPGLRETVTCARLEMKGRQYFNSGILLIDIGKYVKADIGNRAIRLCAAKRFGEMNQDVLNILLEGHVLFDSSFAYNCGMSVRDKEVPDTIYLVHFTGAKKPWKLCTARFAGGVHGLMEHHTWKFEYYALWRKYASFSPWGKIPFLPPANYREWRYLATMYYQSGDKQQALKAYWKYLKYKFGRK